MPADLGERRPVSWHVDQMEAQVIAHMEKQKVLNGEGSPIFLRRRSSFAKVPAGDQVSFLPGTLSVIFIKCADDTVESFKSA